MIPHITRGERMGGLVVYLAGPGKQNEHTEPHLVAGDSAIMAWHGTDELDRAGALQVAREMDHPRRALGVEVPGGHVWHCSLSLRADEGQLTDEQWAQIAEEFVDEMGFSEASGKAPCRWVAIRHGLSGNGNDHLHLAVSLVREDGTKGTAWNDRPRAQRIAGELERKHGLVVLESREHGRGMPGYHPAERHTAARRGQSEVSRDRLARMVRGCATGAGDEAEFVRRVRRAGALIRPRFAHGRDDVVAGYSVAQRPPRGERPVWYGGGHLARDLSLPRLRQQWPDTPEQAEAAVAEWHAAHRGRRVVSPGAETREPDPKLWERYSDEVGRLREQLRSIPVDDQETWAQVARETSGAFAAWSMQVEAEPGPLAAAADSLARSGQLHRNRTMRAKPAGQASARGAAMLLTTVAQGGTGTAAQAMMLRQLRNTGKAIHDAHHARGEAHRAEQLAVVMRDELAQVSHRLPPVLETRDPAQPAPAQRPDREPGSPIPAHLERARRENRTAHQRDRGIGR